MQSAVPDKRPRDLRLSQFYTRPTIAGLMAQIFREHFNLDHFQTVEPSAGDGAFLPFLPLDRLAFDIEPKHPGIEAADFLEITVQSDLPIMMIGNPPFGQNSNLAKAFFNHAASQSLVIAMILPRTFRKASIQNVLDRNFHLFREVDVPGDAFLFRSEKRTVPAVFQIWIRSDRLRALRWTERTHRDFTFVDRADANFAIRRIGVNAGRLYKNPRGEDDSFYFIKGDVWDVMSMLDFQAVARDTAGIPSLSKAEIVGLYDERIRLNRSACKA
ncbi:SAM-dependent methyltransferase [Sphingomonas adhaesiva]|uniref:SAM-dependent methyltransferase n=1 Tax=Sphingomonas adhaesiva TaxID=28212 RepID=A0A2A4I5Q6_9SPHN|nr:SAM-dependent methyltransferase [Sphingomonas adhaesiva]